jgi:alkylhydroperoxidase family enzyme
MFQVRVAPPVWPAEPPADLALQGPLGHQPALWAAFQQLYGTLWSRGVLDHPTKEVARLRNARITGCGL